MVVDGCLPLFSQALRNRDGTRGRSGRNPQSHQKSQNGLFTMARAIQGTPRKPFWASSANARCSAAIGCAASRVCGGLLTSSRMSSKPTSSTRAPNLSSHDLSTTASSDAVRLLQAPAQPRRGKMSAGRAAGTSPIRAGRVYCITARRISSGSSSSSTASARPGNRPPNGASISRKSSSSARSSSLTAHHQPSSTPAAPTLSMAAVSSGSLTCSPVSHGRAVPPGMPDSRNGCRPDSADFFATSPQIMPALPTGLSLTQTTGTPVAARSCRPAYDIPEPAMYTSPSSGTATRLIPLHPVAGSPPTVAPTWQAVRPTAEHAASSQLEEVVPKWFPRRSENPSGRPDLNRRPLDPQDGGLAGIPAQSVIFVHAYRLPTCGLFSALHGVWSPSGPQSARACAVASDA